MESKRLSLNYSFLFCDFFNGRELPNQSWGAGRRKLISILAFIFTFGLVRIFCKVPHQFKKLL